MSDAEAVTLAAGALHSARVREARAYEHLRDTVLAAIANGMTPTEAINLSGVSRRTVYSWINGENNK